MTQGHKILILTSFFLLGLGVFFIWDKNNAQAQIGEEPIKIIDKVNSLTKHPSKQYGTRSLLGIDRILVHHSGGTNGTAEDHAYYHVNTHDWPGIGYHFVVEKDGTILQTNYLDTLSYHSPGMNTSSIGVVLNGNFENEEPTAAQMESLRQLIAHLRGEFMQPLTVSGHRDHRATACPGEKLYKHLQEFNRA